MATVTQATRTQFYTGTGTVTEIAPAAGFSDFSLHDCTDPGQVGAHNEIWPRGGATGQVTFKTGLVVHSRNPQPVANTVKVSKA